MLRDYHVDYQEMEFSRPYRVLHVKTLTKSQSVVGFVGGFGWFWLVPCFSNYGDFHSWFHPLKVSRINLKK